MPSDGGSLKIPAIFQFHEFAEAGGLVSYGGNYNETSRLMAGVRGREPAGSAGHKGRAFHKYEDVIDPYRKSPLPMNRCCHVAKYLGCKTYISRRMRNGSVEPYSLALMFAESRRLRKE